MSTNLQVQAGEQIQGGGFIWHRLHSEREEICEALMNGPRTSEPARLHPAPFGNDNKSPQQLQERLRLLNDALDRLMAGSYGDCTICGRWIEDNKLNADPALAFCLSCRRRAEHKHQRSSQSAHASA